MKNKIALAIAAICMASPSHAEVTFNGFASIVAGSTFDKETSQFGYDDSLSFKPESKFALQTTADLTDGLTATAQIMSRGKNDYNAEFEWAYVSYELSDNSQVSLGRMRIPFYRYSDFLDVGYAYNWLRPPTSVYSLPNSSFEGVSYINNHQLGMADSSVQLIYGGSSSTVNVLGENDISTEGLAGLNWTVSYEWITARIGYFTAETTIDLSTSNDFNTLTGTLSALNLNEIRSDLEIINDQSSFLGFGISVDYENFIADVEFTEVAVEDSLIADQSQYYVSFGYRISDLWTVLATLEHSEDKFSPSKFGQVPGVPELAQLSASVDGILSSSESEHDLTGVSARYNFHPAAALKLDYTSIDRGNGDTRDVFSVGVDLVF